MVKATEATTAMLSRMAVVIAVIYRARSKAEAPARRGTRVDQIRYGRPSQAKFHARGEVDGLLLAQPDLGGQLHQRRRARRRLADQLGPVERRHLLGAVGRGRGLVDDVALGLVEFQFAAWLCAGAAARQGRRAASARQSWQSLVDQISDSRSEQRDCRGWVWAAYRFRGSARHDKALPPLHIKPGR
jgi:hypothetical protein